MIPLPGERRGRRALVIVLDGVGIGELPDAAAYGDSGSDTLGNLARVHGGLSLPHLERLGLGRIAPIAGVAPVAGPDAAWGRMAEVNPGKDSVSGHWELAGLRLPRAFPTYPHAFPADLIRAFERLIGRATLGNEVASGTEIIQRLGAEHVRTGRPIVYTSADSVFQIAAHEEVVPPEDLYAICRAAREFLTGEHAVGRVIARPFLGSDGRFTRTGNRRDFPIPPIAPTLLDRLNGAGWPVVAIGKIVDLFAGRGMTERRITHSNAEGMSEIETALAGTGRGLIMANLVDFDVLWGHRNDPEGFARGLAGFDSWLPRVLKALRQEDLLVITADHGNDPTTPSTDHSREYVPILVTGPRVRRGVPLGVRSTFADLAATLTDHFGLPAESFGTSFHQEVWQ
jgi:phosphopentomutase